MVNVGKFPKDNVIAFGTFTTGASGGVINLGVNPAGVAGASTVGAVTVGASPTVGGVGLIFNAVTGVTVIGDNVGGVPGAVTFTVTAPGSDIVPIVGVETVGGVIVAIVTVGGVTFGASIIFCITVFSTIVFSVTAFGVIFAPKSILSTNSNGFLTIPYSP